MLMVLTITMISSCKKDEAEPTAEPLVTKTNEVTSKSGILIFNDRNALNNKISEFNNLSVDERKAWGQSLNFISQQCIYDDINIAEIELEEELYTGYDENLSIEELEALGVTNPHTDMYNNYLTKGLIKENVYNDGSESFDLSVANSPMAYVINEDGFVIVNDTIYQYTASSAKVMAGNDISKTNVLIAANESQLDKGIRVFDVNSTLKSSLGTTWNSKRKWRYDGSRKRYTVYVVGNSTYSGRYLYSTFYVEAKGQQKSWGSWKYKSYSPIDYISGDWSYRFEYSNGGPFIRGSYLPGSDYRSPFYKKLGGSNHCKYPLEPNGTWRIGSPYFFTDAVRMSINNFKGSFFKGCCGDAINLYQ
ncbi:MAG: hypothetical protein PF517_07940 [Salinivirgaceae bacterium]|jgi:hypothetical protein|nr:hypothetical protein [Salinivirgaceae bacterium]